MYSYWPSLFFDRVSLPERSNLSKVGEHSLALRRCPRRSEVCFVIAEIVWGLLKKPSSSKRRITLCAPPPEAREAGLGRGCFAISSCGGFSSFCAWRLAGRFHLRSIGGPLGKVSWPASMSNTFSWTASDLNWFRISAISLSSFLNSSDCIMVAAVKTDI